jgi:hypothetical protein
MQFLNVPYSEIWCNVRIKWAGHFPVISNGVNHEFYRNWLRLQLKSNCKLNEDRNWLVIF